MKSLQVPNLFIVGFQKCGSSSLFHLLQQHSNIFGTNIKETFYLNDHNSSNYNPNRNIEKGNNEWDQFLKGYNNEKYILEGSVCNFYQNTALKYIKSIEGAKVIFIVRDPVDRVVSNYKYYRVALNKILPNISFEKYLEMIEKGYFKEDKFKYVIEHSRYTKYLELWGAELKETQILLISLKQLKNNPDNLVNEITNFLNINHEPLSLSSIKNFSQKPRSIKLNNIILNNLGKIPHLNKYRGIYKKLMYKTDDFSVNSEIRTKLSEGFKDEYKSLSRLF